MASSASSSPHPALLSSFLRLSSPNIVVQVLPPRAVAARFPSNLPVPAQPPEHPWSENFENLKFEDYEQQQFVDREDGDDVEYHEEDIVYASNPPSTASGVMESSAVSSYIDMYRLALVTSM